MWSASALWATSGIPTESASNPTLCPTVTRTKGTTQSSRLVSALRAHNTCSESASQSPHADPTNNTKETPVSVL